MQSDIEKILCMVIPFTQQGRLPVEELAGESLSGSEVEAPEA